MAKAKRANDRSGAERPRRTLTGTVDDEPGPADSDHGDDSARPDADHPQVEFGTSVRVDEIAVAAMALSDGLQAATAGLPESIEMRRLRRELDDVAGTFRAMAGDLESTAGHLVRLAVNEGQTCGVVWGECPEHGLALMAAGEVTTCRVLGCHREQTGLAEHCSQPASYRVVDAAGPAMLTCAGHALACRLHLPGAVITLASDSLELL